MLRKRKMYLSLNQRQRSELVNGCGGKGGVVKPLSAKIFKEDCNWHDFLYFLGCTEKDRKIADKELKALMLLRISNLPWYKRYILWNSCWLYYSAIRVVGKKFFYYGKTEQEVPIMN